MHITLFETCGIDQNSRQQAQSSSLAVGGGVEDVRVGDTSLNVNIVNENLRTMDGAVVVEHEATDGNAGLSSNGHIEDTAVGTLALEDIAVSLKSGTNGERPGVNKSTGDTGLTHDGELGLARGAGASGVVDDVQGVNTGSIELLDDGKLVTLVGTEGAGVDVGAETLVDVVVRDKLEEGDVTQLAHTISLTLPLVRRA
jgi:hypothetical protein